MATISVRWQDFLLRIAVATSSGNQKSFQGRQQQLAETSTN